MNPDAQQIWRAPRWAVSESLCKKLRALRMRRLDGQTHGSGSVFCRRGIGLEPWLGVVGRGADVPGLNFR